MPPPEEAQELFLSDPLNLLDLLLLLLSHHVRQDNEWYDAVDAASPTSLDARRTGRMPVIMEGGEVRGYNWGSLKMGQKYTFFPPPFSRVARCRLDQGAQQF